jgi:hypothetical protein
MIRRHCFSVAGAVLCAALPLQGYAQQADEPPNPMYGNCRVGFAIIWPGGSKEPLSRDFRYSMPFYADNLPAKEFYMERGGNRYSVTIVDFSSGPRADERIVEAVAAELRKKGETRFQAFATYEVGMPGRQLNIFAPNNRQIRASVYMGDHYLVITEANAVVGDLDAIQFEQSIVLIDENGKDRDRVGAANTDNNRPFIVQCGR